MGKVGLCRGGLLREIEAMPLHHPFKLRYHVDFDKVDWESCAKVLDSTEKKKHLMAGWS